MKTANLAVMFADLAGYTQRTSEQSYEQNAAMLQRFTQVLHTVVRSFRGRVVKGIGDAVLAVFASPTRAVEAAMAIQDRLVQLNRGQPAGDELRLRIAINVGEVRLERGDVFGEAVNVAARIESQTPVDAIYLSEATYLTMNRSGVPLQAVGARQLKGIDDPVALFSVPAGFGTQSGQRSDDGLLPYRGRQLARLRAARRNRALRWMAAACVLGVAGSFGVRRAVVHLRRQAQLTAVHRAIRSERLREAADAIARLYDQGIDVRGPAEDLMAALAHTPDDAGACAILERVEGLVGDASSGVEPTAAARLRLQHGTNLIFAGELAQARHCLADVALPAASPQTRLLQLDEIHLDALDAVRSHAPARLHRQLERYQDYLRAGTAPARHLQLIARVAAAGYEHRMTRPLADSLVLQFLRDMAAPQLAARAVDPTTDAATRNWIIGRLEDVGRDSPLNWLAIYAAQLGEASCAARRSAIASLRHFGDLSAAGLLLREAAKRDRCTHVLARQAAAELVAKGRLGVPQAPKAFLVATR